MLNFIDHPFFLHTYQSLQMLVYKPNLVFPLADFARRVELKWGQGALLEYKLLCLRLQTVHFFRIGKDKPKRWADLLICSPNKSRLTLIQTKHAASADRSWAPEAKSVGSRHGLINANARKLKALDSGILGYLQETCGEKPFFFFFFLFWICCMLLWHQRSFRQKQQSF